MLTLEPPQFEIRGVKILRDFSNEEHYWYLPRDQARVADGGRALSFVAYSEDITRLPDFSQDEDHAGGFLTMEVELGPDPAEVEQIRTELAGRVGRNVTLSQVPFTDGTVSLFLLSQTGAGSEGTPKGFEVTVGGSTKPSLSGRQAAVFSARLGGKAANLLFETLRSKADPQAVVLYDLQYLAVRPSYHLEVEIDFKETFSYLRHRIGLNLLVAAVDLDLMTQEMMNDGKITVREVDFTGRGNPGSPIAGEGGILKLVRDLMSQTLFTTVPMPTPEYRALPDSATRALESASGTKAFITTGEGTPRTPVTVGSDLKITHTPLHAGQTPGGAVDVSATVEPATGVTGTTVKLLWRTPAGSGNFQELPMTRNTAPGTPTTPPAGGATPPAGGATPPAGGATPPAGGATPPAGGATPPAGGARPPGGATPPAGGATPPAGGATPPAGGATPPAGGASPPPSSGIHLSSNPAPGVSLSSGNPPAGDTTYTARIPGQPSGATVEYFIRATGTKAGAAVTQSLPEAGNTAPLSYTVGAVSPQQSGTQLKVPETNGPLIGYSLRSMEVSQQIKRKFRLDKAEAGIEHHRPVGQLSANQIGPSYDPDKQVTHVLLGQGPFKVIVIPIQAGFDFDKNAVRAATVHLAYGRRPDGAPLHALSVTLTRDQPRSQVQFFADEQGTQAYDYWVDFTYDPERTVGLTPGAPSQSPRFRGVTDRSITVDLDKHSPFVPVTVQPGMLSFENGLVRQVQIRVAPSASGEGRVIQLTSGSPGETVMVMPSDPVKRSYFLSQQFFFQDGSTTVDKPEAVDTQVVVNEPNDLIFKMVPQLADQNNLVKEALVDAVYRHATGKEVRSTLHLTSEHPRQEFAVLLAPGDPRQWQAGFRFVMNVGDPLEARPQTVQISEPLVTLKGAGFRVVSVALLDEAIFTSDRDLLGVKVTLGRDVNDPAAPSIGLMLRSTRISGSLVVPELAPDAPVSVAVEVLRRGQPGQRLTSLLAPSEKELFVQL
jgi:hypothetical protein